VWLDQPGGLLGFEPDAVVQEACGELGEEE
jgi:hypothetical protein